MTKNLNEPKFETIVKANNVLIAKIEELKEYLQSNASAFKMGEKEINKYYRLKENEKAVAFKNDYQKKAEAFKIKLDFEISNIKENESNMFLMGLINYYAKAEDGYYDILNVSKKEEMSATGLYKCEVMLDYYLTNLKNINSLESAFNKKLDNFKGLELNS